MPGQSPAHKIGVKVTGGEVVRAARALQEQNRQEYLTKNKRAGVAEDFINQQLNNLEDSASRKIADGSYYEGGRPGYEVSLNVSSTPIGETKKSYEAKKKRRKDRPAATSGRSKKSQDQNKYYVFEYSEYSTISEDGISAEYEIKGRCYYGRLVKPTGELFYVPFVNEDNVQIDGEWAEVSLTNTISGSGVGVGVACFGGGDFFWQGVDCQGGTLHDFTWIYAYEAGGSRRLRSTKPVLVSQAKAISQYYPGGAGGISIESLVSEESFNEALGGRSNPKAASLQEEFNYETFEYVPDLAETPGLARIYDTYDGSRPKAEYQYQQILKFTPV
jgi:hypothetical protein